MVPRRAEGVFSHKPSLAEQHEVDVRSSLDAGRRGEHREDRRVWVVEQDRADRAVGGEVVLHRRIVAVPGDHVER